MSKLSDLQKNIKNNYGPYQSQKKKQDDIKKNQLLKNYENAKAQIQEQKKMSEEDYDYATSGQIGYNGTPLETTLTDEQKNFLTAKRQNREYTGFDEKQKAIFQQKEDKARDYAYIRNYNSIGAEEYLNTQLAEDEKKVKEFLASVVNDSGTIDTKRFISSEKFDDVLPALGRMQRH